MEYIVIIFIFLFSFFYSLVLGGLSEKKMKKFLIINKLKYCSHTRITGTKEIKEKFTEDVNPFLFLFYYIQYYKMICHNSDNVEVVVYVKWYTRIAFFLSSKGVFVR